MSGECLLDKIELVKAGRTSNRVSNSDFEGGWTVGVPWHARTVRLGNRRGICQQPQPACAGQQSGTLHDLVLPYHLRPLSTTITAPRAGETFTIRAKGRWLAGWPYIVIGIKGHALEAVGALELPRIWGRLARQQPSSGQRRARHYRGAAFPDVAGGWCRR
jgi:hypothetical protein